MILFLFFIRSDLFHQGINELIFRDGSEDLPFAEDQATAFSAGDAEICLPGFARTIHGAAHDGDFDGFLKVRDLLLHFFGHLDEIHLRAAACRAGNEDRALLLHAHGAQDFLRCFYFLHRIIGQRYTKGIANAV